MIITERINITRDRSKNYIPVGQWDATEVYKLSDMGIPVVEVPDSTALGFSVYALDTAVSTKGKKPSGNNSEWRLMESAEFIYMLQAYIKHLRATIITAEYIESLMIRTKNLEVLNGAKIGSYSIENGEFSSAFSFLKSVMLPNVGYPVNVLVSGLVRITDKSFNLTSSFGGTDDLPQKTTNSVEITPSMIKMKTNVVPSFSGSDNTLEITSSGVYINGEKKL